MRARFEARWDGGGVGLNLSRRWEVLVGRFCTYKKSRWLEGVKLGRGSVGVKNTVSVPGVLKFMKSGDVMGVVVVE